MVDSATASSAREALGEQLAALRKRAGYTQASGFVRSGEDGSVRWIMSYWDEEDVTFFFEVGDDGWVVRQVELTGQDQRPIAAAALAEWIEASEAGGVEAYEARFGCVAELPIGDWDAGFPQVDLSLAEYDEVWRGARRFLDDDVT